MVGSSKPLEKESQTGTREEAKKEKLSMVIFSGDLDRSLAVL